MTRYKLTLAYDGSPFCGWQRQQNGTSIQALCEVALSTWLRHPTSVTASGRTDAGVHARGQVAHFDTPISFDPTSLLSSLNGMLPPQIRIVTVTEVSPQFHARYSALSKEYHYHISQGPSMDPFRRLYAYHYSRPLNMDAIDHAMGLLEGTHDFTSLSNAAHEGSASRGAVRTLYRLSCHAEPGGYRWEFEGNGFLYKMVRNLMGVLLDVGIGKRAPETIPELLEARDRRQASRAAPPHGLFLMEVRYPEDVLHPTPKKHAAPHPLANDAAGGGSSNRPK